MQTIEVEIDATGHIHPLESIQNCQWARALLTLLNPPVDEALQLADPTLAENWLKPENDTAWAHLQMTKLSAVADLIAADKLDETRNDVTINGN